MRNQKKTSAYKVIEEAVASGQELPFESALLLGMFLVMAHVRAWLGFAPGTAAHRWAERIWMIATLRREWWLIEYEWAQPIIVGERRLPERSVPRLGRREEDKFVPA